MVDVEELMSKIKSGVWSTQDAFDCIKDLEQEYLQIERGRVYALLGPNDHITQSL